MKTYSTVKVTKKLGIAWSTLYRWIVDEKIKAPAVRSLDGFEVRLWTEEDIARVRKYKAEHYWGLGNKKPRKKQKTSK
jgi:predicted site-specific integrase-resolvase